MLPFLSVSTSHPWLSWTLVVLSFTLFLLPLLSHRGCCGGIPLPALINISLTGSSSGCHIPPWPCSLLWHIFHKPFAFIGKGTTGWPYYLWFLVYDRQYTLHRLHASLVVNFCAYLLLRHLFVLRWRIRAQICDLCMVMNWYMCAHVHSVCLPLLAGLWTAYLYVIDALLLTPNRNLH